MKKSRSDAQYLGNLDLKNQSTDQVFVGAERQIAASMGVNASFVWKQEGNFIRLQDVRG